MIYSLNLLEEIFAKNWYQKLNESELEYKQRGEEINFIITQLNYEKSKSYIYFTMETDKKIF